MKTKEPKTLCTDEWGTLYEDFEESPRHRLDAEDICSLVARVALYLLAVVILVFCVYNAVKEGKAKMTERKIEQAIIEELKLQATDYGVDGDEYVVFLFPATTAYTEVTEEGGRLYLAYIIGSGTDDEGEWQLVKYEPGGNISTFDIP